MIKQSIVLSLLAVAFVHCDDSEGATNNIGASLGQHLRDLGRVAISASNNAYQEAKPTLDNIHKDLNEGFNQLKESPHVKMVAEHVERVKNDPRVQQAYNQVQVQVQRVKNDPRVQQGIERAKPHLEKLKSRINEESERYRAKLRDITNKQSGQQESEAEE